MHRSARPFVRFLILGDARTGSTLLAEALNSHPEIVCFREVFHFAQQDSIDYAVAGYDGHDVADLALRSGDPPRFLRERIFGDQPPSVRAVGFKYLYSHFAWFPGVDEALVADGDLHVIHLGRSNLLRLYVSAQIAVATGRWLQRRAPEPRSRLKFRLRRVLRRVTASGGRDHQPAQDAAVHARAAVTISPGECLAFFDRHRKDLSRAGAMFAGHPLLRLDYEDFLADRDAAFSRAQRFLGVSPRKLSVTLERQNPEPLPELIANYDDVAEALRAAGFARFLVDE